MSKQGINKFRVMAAVGLVVAALASAPAQAHHETNYVAPLAAFIAFSALYHHSHHNRHRYYGHGGHGGHYGHRPRRHSHSHDGYHKPRRKHGHKW